MCRKTDLTAFVGELVDMFKPQAADKKITLTFDHSGQPDEKVWIDRDNLDKILVNIISNAIKYTQPGGEITVSLSTANSLKSGGVSSVIRVTDTGIGINPENKEKIFDRFVKLDHELAGRGTRPHHLASARPTSRRRPLARHHLQGRSQILPLIARKID